MSELQSLLDNLSTIKDFKSVQRDLNKLIEYREALFARHEFKKDDWVRLTRTPRIDAEHSWGWGSAKHFLVEGALARITSVNFHLGKFRYTLSFAEESYNKEWNKSKEPDYILTPHKHTFCFSEGDIILAENGADSSLTLDIN